MAETLPNILNLGQESDIGDTEYKYQLIDLSPAEIQKKAIQMKYRLNSDENYGQAVYAIGVVDDGFALGLDDDSMRESLETLEKIATLADAKICGIQTRKVTHHAKSEEQLINKYLKDHRYHGKPAPPEEGSTEVADMKREESKQTRGGQKFVRTVAEVIIRKNVSNNYIELRCGVAGHVDCGKSTLLGVLTRGELDNAKGSARAKIVVHKHENESGRTSSVGQHIIGFNQQGQMINDLLAQQHHRHFDSKKLDWPAIVAQSSKIITFFDLAGHEKYLRTTISGISSNSLDYALIMVGANMGRVMDSMTVEHIRICTAYKILPIVIITKIDMAPPLVLQETLEEIKKILKTRFSVYSINTDDQVMSCIRLLSTSNDVVPILKISNVTGEGMDRLKYFLNLLPLKHNYTQSDGDSARFQVQEVFSVNGVGTVVGGILTHGTVRIQDLMHLGPDGNGKFIQVRVKNIECKRTPMDEVTCGRYVCLNLAKVERKLIRTNMFLLAQPVKAVWEFIANVKIARTKSCCISVDYQPHCHIGHIRQTCKILSITNEKGESLHSIGAGDEAILRIRFCFRPEVIFDDDRKKFLFREGNTRGVGSILQTTDTIHIPIANKLVTKHYKIGRAEKQRRKALRRQLNPLHPSQLAEPTVTVQKDL